jgi:uncharacterized protein YkwD
MHFRWFVIMLWGLLAAQPTAYGQTASKDRAQSKSQARPARRKKESGQDLVARHIIERTNRFRRSHKLPEVKVNQLLTETAREFADFMAETEKYGHDADGSLPHERAARHKYEYCVLAENIAYQRGFGDFSATGLASFLVNAWRASPGHRKNLLDPDVTEIGVGLSVSENSGSLYAVQMFGMPRSAAIKFTVANESKEKVEYQFGDDNFDLRPFSSRIHQQFRQRELKFEWAESQGSSRTFKPRADRRYIVSMRDGKLQAREEEALAAAKHKTAND